ncbi:MAG: aminocyclopropane-1-carboxylate deaminase/D-cysteine desulfhydrase family protein, partial [Myxococcota bacterium]
MEPVFPASTLGIPGSRLWVLDTGRASERYGGNKVRKLGHLLDDAVRTGATDVYTVGPVGSHHV